MILKGVGGFYSIVLEDGEIITCKARGRFKNEGIQPMPGDKVKTSKTNDGEGVIEEVFPRITKLYRPPVANVNQAVILFSIKKPDININLLDRLLVLAESNSLDIIICLNKMDLDSSEKFKDIVNLYRGIGYKLLLTSALTGEGINDIKVLLKDKLTVVAGPSGAGKSTLLNNLCPGIELATGEISTKLKKGRHTTRHVELIPMDFGGYVADTPGFSQLNLKDISSNNLTFLFPEMAELVNKCRFNSCLHLKEPGCIVKEKVDRGEISSTRYSSYIQLINEIREMERSY